MRLGSLATSCELSSSCNCHVCRDARQRLTGRLSERLNKLESRIILDQSGREFGWLKGMDVSFMREVNLNDVVIGWDLGLDTGTVVGTIDVISFDHARGDHGFVLRFVEGRRQTVYCRDESRLLFEIESWLARRSFHSIRRALPGPLICGPLASERDAHSAWDELKAALRALEQRVIVDPAGMEFGWIEAGEDEVHFGFDIGTTWGLRMGRVVFRDGVFRLAVEDDSGMRLSLEGADVTQIYRGICQAVAAQALMDRG